MKRINKNNVNAILFADNGNLRDRVVVGPRLTSSRTYEPRLTAREWPGF